MNLLISETESLKLITDSSGSIHYFVNYEDINTNDGYKFNSTSDIITTATTTTILSSPSAGFRKRVFQVVIFNNGSQNTVTLFNEKI